VPEKSSSRENRRNGRAAGFVRMTFTKSDPASAEAARVLYNSDEVSGVLERQKGHRFHYLLESADVPGEGVSVTAWDSREDAEAYERSGGLRGTRGQVRELLHRAGAGRVLRGARVSPASGRGGALGCRGVKADFHSPMGRRRGFGKHHSRQPGEGSRNRSPGHPAVTPPMAPPPPATLSSRSR
jgi:heme-degrading monooxygenase HmoA